MSDSHTHILDLANEVEPPQDGILTRTVYNDDDVKAVIFGAMSRLVPAAADRSALKVDMVILTRSHEGTK